MLCGIRVEVRNKATKIFHAIGGSSSLHDLFYDVDSDLVLPPHFLFRGIQGGTPATLFPLPSPKKTYATDEDTLRYVDRRLYTIPSPNTRDLRITVFRYDSSTSDFDMASAYQEDAFRIKDRKDVAYHAKEPMDAKLMDRTFLSQDASSAPSPRVRLRICQAQVLGKRSRSSTPDFSVEPDFAYVSHDSSITSSRSSSSGSSFSGFY